MRASMLDIACPAPKKLLIPIRRDGASKLLPAIIADDGNGMKLVRWAACLISVIRTARDIRVMANDFLRWKQNAVAISNQSAMLTRSPVRLYRQKTLRRLLGLIRNGAVVRW